jgi:Spy/CpxP family protein refolding chaperone
MMEVRMKRSMLLAVLLSLLFTIPLIAQPGPMGDRPLGPGPAKRILDELKLTEDQQKKVQELRFDLMKQMAAQRSRIATAMIEFRELAAKENPDKSALEKKIKEISELRTQARTMMLNQWFNVNKLLTPEQQKVWKKALEGRMWMERRGEMRERFRGMMRGHMGDHRGPAMRERY